MHFTICHFQTLLDEKEGLFCVIFVYLDPDHLKSIILGTISTCIRSLIKNYACLIEISPKCLGVLFDGQVDHLTNGKDGCYSIAIWTAGMATGPLPIVPGMPQ